MKVPYPLEGAPRERLLQALARISDFSARVRRACADEIACREGCDLCCRQVLNLRGVEAAYLLEGARRLPPLAVSLVWKSLAEPDLDRPCPLLHGSSCLTYDHRPVVCRTHGLPMVRAEREHAVLHHCPENFREADPGKLSPALLLDEERLSLLMDTIEAFYSKETGWDGSRVAVDELLRRGLQP